MSTLRQQNNKQTIKKIISAKLKNEDEAFLFGSYVEGKYDEYSDVDLMIITRSQKDFFSRVLDYIDLKLSIKNLELFIYTPEEVKLMIEAENPFINNILKNGERICGIPKTKQKDG